jgi:signal transduction histidine kinase
VTVKFEAPPEPELAAVRADNARLREELKRAERLLRELRDAVAARDAFIAIAGHELRNPMGAVMIAATSLAHRAAHTEEVVPEWLAPRLDSLERQARLFVRRATAILDVSLTSNLAPAVHGWWDRVALEQIVTNLVQNAVKYGAGKPIHVAVSAEDGYATLTVRDGGIGISELDRERIFARFERAVTQHNHGGFGLGLWITRALVEASGGTIRVESTPGAGSIFTVVLPQAVEQPPR